MVISTPRKERLGALYFSYRDCRACALHRNRKLIVRGTGNPDASVMFVLDRLSPVNLQESELLSDGEGGVLQSLLAHLGRDVRDFWVTASVLCATGDLTPDKFGRDPELFTPPKPAHLVACQNRLHEEIRIVQPEVIIACGTAALRGISLGVAPKYTENVGQIIEVHIKGALVNYPVPVMVSQNLNMLYRTPDLKPGGLWHDVCRHYHQAVSTAENLRERRNNNEK